MKQPALQFGSELTGHLTVAPSAFLPARETSALAAVDNVPRKGTQNATVLHFITAAGSRGLSDRELERLTGYLRSTICARRGDLAGLLEPADTRDLTNPHRPQTRWRRRYT